MMRHSELFNLIECAFQGAYERVLVESLDSLISKIEVTKTKWEGESVAIQEKNKKTLLEFGLNHLDI